MNRTGEARISQCMIVKNEEEVIRRALSWGKEIVSEQIVVDTGSTDRTVEIAEQMGAKVYHFQWVDDFAAAKNFAIDQAQYEWIAFLDADEYFPPEDAKKLLYYVKELQNTEFQGILAGRANVDNEGNVVAVNTECRVFRNSPIIRYKRRIHEYLMTTDESFMHMADAVEELTMYHTGYGETEFDKKAGRNLKLIKKELEDDPASYQMWGYLGQEYQSQENWEEARHAFQKAMELMPEKDKGVYDVPTSLAALRLIETLVHLQGRGSDETELLEAYRYATENWPEEADYDYALGLYFPAHGNFEAGEKHLRRALDLLERYGNTSKAMMLSGEIRRAYELLAVCCYNNRELGECVRFTTILLKEDPYLMSTAMVMFRAFHEDMETFRKGEEGITDILMFLGNIYDFGTLKDRLFLLRAAMAAGYPELIRRLRELFTPEENAAVEQALKQR